MKSPTHICKSCFNDFNDGSFHSFFNSPTICNKCLKEYNPIFKKFKILDIDALTIYEYEGKVKENIFIFKSCGDYELKDTFLSSFVIDLRIMFYNFIMLPAPSSEESNLKRGFNHVKEIFGILGLPMYEVFKKVSNHKQSNLSYLERQNVGNVLSIDNAEITKNKNVLIVDDICTTGATLKALIELIKPFNPKQIKVLVIAKRDMSEEEISKIKNSHEIL